MLTKVPSSDWTDHIEYMMEEDDDSSDLEDEPDFAEYLWMENEEEFDKNELQRLEEEDLMNECLEAMLDDELEQESTEWRNPRSEHNDIMDLHSSSSEFSIERSLLNPFADEFIPKNQVLFSSSL